MNILYMYDILCTPKREKTATAANTAAIIHWHLEISNYKSFASKPDSNQHIALIARLSTKNNNIINYILMPLLGSYMECTATRMCSDRWSRCPYTNILKHNNIIYTMTLNYVHNCLYGGGGWLINAITFVCSLTWSRIQISSFTVCSHFRMVN